MAERGQTFAELLPEVKEKAALTRVSQPCAIWPGQSSWKVGRKSELLATVPGSSGCSPPTEPNVQSLSSGGRNGSDRPGGNAWQASAQELRKEPWYRV